MVRRLVFALLTMAALAPAAASAASTASARHHNPRVRVTLRGDLDAILRMLNEQRGIQRVAVRDVDNDGDLDVIAAPRHGALRLWRNGGHGRFALAALRRHIRSQPPGARFSHVRHGDDAGQWGDERADAAVLSAPATRAAIIPVSLVRASSAVVVSPVSLRRFSGRAPPRA